MSNTIAPIRASLASNPLEIGEVVGWDNNGETEFALVAWSNGTETWHDVNLLNPR